MTYKALCPVISQAEAEELGRFLGQYAVTVGRLEVWQIHKSGKRAREDALRNAILDTAGAYGGAAFLAPIAAPVMVAAAPLWAPLAALLAPFVAPILALDFIAIPLSSYHARRNLPSDSTRDPIEYTELVFTLAAVSDRRAKWSEYLLSIYAARHTWTQLAGLRYPGQWEAGARYAASHAGYPRPWADRRPGDRAPEVTPPVAPVKQAAGNQQGPGSSGRGRRALRDLWG